MMNIPNLVRVSIAYWIWKGKKIFICSPYRGDEKKNLENVKRYCRDAAYDGIPIALHLYFTQFLDEKYDRYKGMLG